MPRSKTKPWPVDSAGTGPIGPVPDLPRATVSAILRFMLRRALALILLVAMVAVPVSAAFCGNCAPAHCPPEGPAQKAEPAPKHQADAPMGHCATMKSEVEAPVTTEMSPTAELSPVPGCGCCSPANASERATLRPSSTLVPSTLPSLQGAPSFVGAVVEPTWSQISPAPPPRPSPRSLLSLHSVLLI